MALPRSRSDEILPEPESVPLRRSPSVEPDTDHDGPANEPADETTVPPLPPHQQAPSVPVLHVGRRERFVKITWLFVSLMLDFYLRFRLASLRGQVYDFHADRARNRKRAIRFRTVALEMGGVLVKLGQFLSTRADFLPPEYLEELGLLQDQVPEIPFEAVREAVYRELGGPIEQFYGDFDPEPLAAASLGQVHRAILPTGEDVAVKIQRPDIETLVEADLSSLRFVVSLMKRFRAVRRQLDMDAFYREFAMTLRRELDYMQEGHSAERFAWNFRDDPEVAIPNVYWSLTTRRLLTLQYVYGIKVNNYEALERAGINRKRMAEILVRAYLDQILEHGFFHADPHPGNLFVRPGPVMVFVDFGMVGYVTDRMRQHLQDAYLAITRRDVNSLVDALMNLGFIRRGVDLAPLRRSLGYMLDRFWGSTLAELQQVDPAEFTDELETLIYDNPIQLPANVAFLGRAIGTLSGLATGLDPSFQILTVVEPYARRLARRGLAGNGIVGVALNELQATGRAAYALPRLAHQTLSRLTSGELKIQQESNELVFAVRRLNRDVRRLTRAVIVSSLLAGAAYVWERFLKNAR